MIPPTIRFLVSLCAISIPLMVSTACCQVSYQAEFYNQEGSFSESITMDNAQYSGFTTLLPYSGFGDTPTSITSMGSGKSTASSSRFSHSMSSTSQGGHEAISASVETVSGGFAWGKSAKVSSDGSPMALGVSGGINGGTLVASFSNIDSSLMKDVKAMNSKYSFKSAITPESIVDLGYGASQYERDCGFSSWVEAESLGKIVTMETSLGEMFPTSRNVDHEWMDKTILLPGRSTMGEIVEIETREGYTLSQIGYLQIEAGMEFEAKDTATGNAVFESQFVPRSGELRLAARPDPLHRNTQDTVEMSMLANWRPMA